MRQTHLTKTSTRRVFLIFCLAVQTLWARPSNAQGTPYERTFAQSKVEVEKTLKELQPSASGRLPALDGFTSPGDRPLDRFQRGYYQCVTQVNSTPSGGALVRVSAKITAWYADPISSKSGYQVLPSNGRLETDFLDRLDDALGGKTASVAANLPVSLAPSQPRDKPQAPAPAISAPTPGVGVPTAASKVPATPANSPFKLGNAVSSDRVASLATQKAVADKHMEDLTKEAKGLEEILRNQGHPNNLVAVKKSGTQVLVSPIEGAKVLFLATAEDEFEILDMNANWVHVRISGLSRGWIRRTGLEMPGTSASDAKAGNDSAAANPEHFQVKDEQIATFPGTWEPLRGKTVKILTVQKTSGSASDTGWRAKLEFAKSLFEKAYTELTQASTSAAGVVLIFDSEDGGMAAATLPTLQQWRAGTLSDQAFWRRCFLDPPEIFTSKTSQ
ncbi:MAG TPA: hypothetical protein VN948_04405 [Terriglobales bacterium]|nr:hypothetical protein [Terriglobales bacterium]